MGTPELKQWRDQLIGDSGDLLLEAARRYLGPVKTPFNKHQLAAGLEAWLRRPETVTAILATLNSTELRLLALLHLAGPLRSDHLAILGADTSRGISFRQTEALLVQLKQRLLVFGCGRVAGADILVINPVLYDSLAAELNVPALLAGNLAALPQQDTDSVWRTALVLISVAMHVKALYKRPGVFSKKAEVLMETLLGSLDEAHVQRFHHMAGCMRNCGILVEHEDGSCLPEPEAFLEFVRSFGLHSALVLLAASEGLAEIPLSLMDVSAFLFKLCTIMVGDVAYSEDDCLRLIVVCLAPCLPATGPGSVQTARLPELAKAVLDTLLAAGLLRRLEHAFQSGPAMPALLELCSSSATDSGRRLVIEESHELQLLPGFDPQAEAWVALMARPLKVDLVWTAIVDKPAAVAAFGFGFKLDDYCQGWQRFTGKPLPQSLRFSFESWYKEYSAVRLRQGVLVVLDEHLSWSLEHNRKAEGLVREKLAEGVYLLAARSLPEAEKLLAAVGIHTDVRGQVNRQAGIADFVQRPLRLNVDDLYKARSRPEGTAFFGQAELGLSWPAEVQRADPQWLVRSEQRDEAVQSRVRGLLEELATLNYDRAVSEVLSEKIRSRIIVEASQLHLKSGLVDIVAGAMDYPGKVRLLERSLKDRVPVELSWTDPSGSKLACTGVVSALEKQADGMVAAIRVYAANEELRLLQVRSLSKVRLLQGL